MRNDGRMIYRRARMNEERWRLMQSGGRLKRVRVYGWENC